MTVPGVSRRPFSCGLTLVELLVVTAVILMLAGILLPVLERARAQGQRALCLSHLRQIGHAQLLYLDDWDGCFAYWYAPWPARPEFTRSLRFWPQYLQPYLRDQGILRDPAFLWPGRPAVGTKLADYSLLTWGPGGRGTRDDPYWRWPGPPLALAQVRRPAETFNVMEGYTTTAQTWSHMARHGEGINVAFVDGHARWLLPRQLKRIATDGHGAHWLHYGAADR